MADLAASKIWRNTNWESLIRRTGRITADTSVARLWKCRPPHGHDAIVTLTHMEKQLRWFVIVMACIGAIAILGAMGWGALFFAFKDFAGGNCTDSEQKILFAPDGSHSIKSFHRNCGGFVKADEIRTRLARAHSAYTWTGQADSDHAGSQSYRRSLELKLVRTSPEVFGKDHDTVWTTPCRSNSLRGERPNVGPIDASRDDGLRER